LVLVSLGMFGVTGGYCGSFYRNWVHHIGLMQQNPRRVLASIFCVSLEVSGARGKFG
jgi:hypothetical protein